MTHVGIYVRISADREGAGLGVERQEKDCRELAQQLGWDVADVYTDNDISAYSSKPRNEYKRLLADLESGAVDGVLAWHTDRLYRKPRDLEPLVELAKTNGIAIQTVKAGKLDLSTATGVLLAGILAEVSRYEVTHTQERLEGWHRAQAAKGRSHGGSRPFGWNPDRITVNPDEAAEIRQWADHILGGGSLGEIVRDLNRRGVPTASWRPPLVVAPWTKQQVRQILLRRRLAGWRVHRGKVITQGEWEPILTDDVHRQVVAVLSNPQRYTGPAVHGRRHLLTGLAVCGQCETPVIVKTGSKPRGLRGETKRSYHCSTCGIWRAMVPVDAYVKGYVVALLMQFQAEPEWSIDPTVRAGCESLRRRIDDELDKYADEDDAFSREEHRRVVRRLKARLAVEERKLLPPRRSVLIRGLTGEDALSLWEKLPLDRQRAVIAELLEVRLLRVERGRAFRPESVEITRRLALER